MKAVHFGAGNIGRGFIGPMLSASGYEVCFVVRNVKKESLLRKKGAYPVVLANRKHDKSMVSKVTAVNTTEPQKVAGAIAKADVVTTAVGIGALEEIAPSIAQGIELRLSAHPRPLHIMACENGAGASTRLKRMVYDHLRPGLHAKANRYVAFPNTAVDRIVPKQSHPGNSLTVMVEPFYEWVIDRSALLNDYPEIEGAVYADSLEPYLERKLFTVNTGHACATYLGYLEGFRTIQEAMAHPPIFLEVCRTLQETGTYLIAKYGWDQEKHESYIRKVLDRFRNPDLTDEIVRVGRSPIRKLSPRERLTYPAMQAHELGMEVPGLVRTIAAALCFAAPEDPEAVKLQAELAEKGVERVLSEVTGIGTEHPLHARIVAEYQQMKQETPSAQAVNL
ncbi:mannitol-1-phosphate 5-dehydrogenase [Gorillibacterium timonense]|uniref:mannitol-1-phosphate 5-dehydrogenase n=1 Tax=Gorillibacterium timonense TaxID=1689269 RepID=UPI00071C3858|nr:mannitol-1-phosphate 5-dehydrogenase [Gorillibacterium timonense]